MNAIIWSLWKQKLFNCARWDFNIIYTGKANIYKHAIGVILYETSAFAAMIIISIPG